MGADVEWNQETQTATATMNNTAVAFSINDTNAEVNGTAATMDVPARLINDKTMVPLRFLSEEMGYTAVSYTHLDVYKRQDRQRSYISRTTCSGAGRQF